MTLSLRKAPSLLATQLDEDWSDIEAWLDAPASTTVKPAPPSASRRLSVPLVAGLLALAMLGGGAAVLDGSTVTAACVTGGCRARIETPAPAEVAVDAPNQVAVANPPVSDVPSPIVQGRSAALPEAAEIADAPPPGPARAMPRPAFTMPPRRPRDAAIARIGAPARRAMPARLVKPRAAPPRPPGAARVATMRRMARQVSGQPHWQPRIYVTADHYVIVEGR